MLNFIGKIPSGHQAAKGKDYFHKEHQHIPSRSDPLSFTHVIILYSNECTNFGT